MSTVAKYDVYRKAVLNINYKNEISRLIKQIKKFEYCMEII